MLPGMEMLVCPNLAVSPEVMQHVVQVESDANPYAIGVVGGQLARQPRNLDEALATARMLEREGYNFSVGIAQVNRANLGRYGLDSYRKAFNICDNLAAGAQILARCYRTAHGDWGKAFSCYYSGNFTTGFRDGYVQKVYASINREADKHDVTATHAEPVDRAIPLAAPTTTSTATRPSHHKNALRPVLVYSSDSTEYRVALRSVVIDTATTAMMPLVVSAAGHSPHLEATALADAMVQQPSREEAGQVAASSSRTNAPVSRAVTSNAPHAVDDGVFEPQVRGPNDPTTASTALAQESTNSHADGADLRLEQRDAAFVF